jgi:hypothetical protein
MVQVLVDYKADVDAQGHNSWTPIHYVPEGSCLPHTPQYPLIVA